jgi:hypothetical protein
MLVRLEAAEHHAERLRARLAQLLRLQERASLVAPGARQLERLLLRVHDAAAEAHAVWEEDGDLDDAMRRLRAELRSAAEFV